MSTLPPVVSLSNPPRPSNRASTFRARWKRFLLIAAFLFGLAGSLAPPRPVGAAGIPDPRFGVVEAHAAPAAAAALGAGWTRVTFRWNEIQPNGPNEWGAGPISDQALNTELAQGRQVVGLLVTTPGWATDMDIGPGVPKGLYLPADDPNNLWANYVRAIVGRYAGRIDHWIVWNEPDIPDTRHMSWGGSVEDFVRLLQVAYTVAKQTNPNAVIHMAAVTHWWNEHWFGQFLDALVADPHAAANNYYFDAATLHIYFQPETVYDITAHYDGMMRGHGIRKPIWIAETNAAPSRDPAWPVPNAQFDISLDEQAYYIVQALSLGIAAGAERIAVYKMADTATDRAANPEPFGLVRMDGSRRPAFTAYRAATTHLAGFRGGSWDRRDDISLVTVDRGARTTTVIWARTPEPQTAMIPARKTRALLVDVWGGAHYVYPERGYYYVELPGADCSQGCLMGGAPYMLVEEATASANTAPAPSSPTSPPQEEEEKEKTPDATPTVFGEPVEPTSGEPVESTRGEPVESTRGEPVESTTPTFTPTATPSPSPTPTSTPTATTRPSPTSTPKPTSTPTPTPSPTPIPLPTSSIPLARPWILVVALGFVLGGLAVAADRSRGLLSRSRTGDAL